MGSCRQSGLALWVCVAALAWLSPSRVNAAEGIAVVTNERGEKVYVNDTGSTHVDPQSAHDCRRGRCTPGAVGNGSFAPLHAHAATFQSSSTASPITAPPEKLDDLIDQTAARHHVDPQLVEAIVQVESEGNPRALSPKGAQGLMQLIPATAERMGVHHPYDPGENVEGGVSYLRYLLDLFGGDTSLALAGYNAGENSVMRYGGVPPIKETQSYVRKVNELYDGGGSGDNGSTHSGAPLATTPAPPSIYRYVDGQGVVHYANQ